MRKTNQPIRAEATPRLQRPRSGASLSRLRGTRRTWTGLCLGLLLAGAGPGGRLQAGERPPSPSSLRQGPLIRFSHRIWDFGRLPQFDRREHTFTIRNDGTEPLEILKVEPDCGCLLAEPAAGRIAPGDSTTLRVIFETRDFEGEQSRVVILETNDPAEPRVDLALRAVIVPEVECAPRVLNFGKVRRGERPVLHVELKAQAGVPFRVSPPTQGTERVVWKVTRDPSLGPNAYRVDGTLRADAPFGRFNEWVEIPVEHAKYKVMRISIRGLVHSYFVPAEVGVNFGTPVAGAAVERTLRIESDGSEAYRITGVETTAPQLAATIREDGTDYLVTVRLDASQPAAFLEQLRLTTTDPEQPVLTVDVKANVLPKGSPEASGGTRR